jgi:hypothetical protein
LTISAAWESQPPKERQTMNQYGTMARDHWARWLPGRYAHITDPDTFFANLGEEVAQQIGDLMMDLAGDDPPGEGYLAKVGRLNMARLQAEELVLAERVLLEPEPAASEDHEPPGTLTPAPAPARVDRNHPLWDQVNAEQQERLQGS